MKNFFQAVFILCNISLCSDRAFAQSITFQKSIGGNKEDYANSVQQTKKLTLIFLMILFSFSSYCFAQCTKLLDFSGPNGSGPNGSLIYDGTYLYGMTETGGINNAGIIFKVKSDGTEYADILHFNDTNGFYPEGSLINDGTFLYGMTPFGGKYGEGNIFKIKPDGTAFTELYSFEGLNGSSPWGSLVSDGTFLYGMTGSGGTNGWGTVFKIKLDGTDFSKLLDFNDINGRNGLGTFIIDGFFLYGMTTGGGANNMGTIFKIKFDGSGYSKLFEFDSLNGKYPYGSLISDGTFLYGMTSYGGTYDMGVIFKIKTDGAGFVKLLDFDGTNGKKPNYGSLISDGTFLYGMTSLGGLNNKGVIFKIKPDGTGFNKLLDFEGVLNGAYPNGSLIFDGISLYGMTNLGGIDYKGVVFKCDISTGIFGKKIESDYNFSSFNIFPNPSSSKISS